MTYHVGIAMMLLLGLPVVGLAVSGEKAVPRAKTETGVVEGVALDGGVAVFRGIPYAAPPVGDLRWRPPQPVPAWDGVRPATEFSAACPQPDVLSLVYGVPLPPTDEDCLYLNVWTANAGDAEPRPVMVWIHGGGFYLGWGHQSTYDGSELARKGAVVVTINYRLGPLGLMAHPALSAESGREVSGNYSLLDQIAALQWVRRNIAAFGGDPGRVTIFGESTGGSPVICLMASPLAKGLFQRAISESGVVDVVPQRLRESADGAPSAEAVGRIVEQRLGVDPDGDVLAQMRARPAEEILAAARPTLGFDADEQGLHFRPTVDGWVLPEPPVVALSRDQGNVVPLIVGSNANEGTVFLPSMGKLTVDGFRAQARRDYGDLADRFLELYPVSAPAELPRTVDRAMTDRTFTTVARLMARLVSGRGAAAYLYQFTRVRPGPMAMLGAYHGSEIPFVFDAFPPERPKDRSDAALTEAMSSYWVQFAATGDPNREGLPAWPVYERAGDRHLELGDEIRVSSGLRKQACDFFEALYVAQSRATHQ